MMLPIPGRLRRRHIQAEQVVKSALVALAAVMALEELAHLWYRVRWTVSGWLEAAEHREARRRHGTELSLLAVRLPNRH
jgi:hypothetical protein